MYDENQIEDSLAFCKELKAFFDENPVKSAQEIVNGAKTAEQGIPKVVQEQPQPAVTPKVSSTPEVQPAVTQKAAEAPEVQPQPETSSTQNPQSAVQKVVQSQVQPQREVPGTVQHRSVPTQSVVENTVPKQGQMAQLSADAAVTVKKTQPVPKENSVADEAIEKLRAMRKAKEAAENVATENATGQADRNVAATQAADAKYTAVEEHTQDGGKHTYEITIKLDLDSIKGFFHKIIDKLKPESPTLEDVNAAMEENRLLQEEKQKAKATKQAAAAQEPAEENGILQKAKQAASALPKWSFGSNAEQKPADGEEVLDAASIAKAPADVAETEKEHVIEERFREVKEAAAAQAPAASRLVTNILILAFCIGIAYFLASFVTSYVAHQTTVEGESMEPTLSDGDTIIIQKLTYYFKDPSRYDVVVFPVTNNGTDEKNTYYIKRVIGLPGETVQIIDGSIYINGSPLQDDKYALSDILEPGIAQEPLTLGKDQYFVMGDNRNMSTDSRNSYVGLVNKNDIVGEAWICTWPLNHFGSLQR